MMILKHIFGVRIGSCETWRKSKSSQPKSDLKKSIWFQKMMTMTVMMMMINMISINPGDVSDNSSPEAEAYVHDATGDA